MPLIYLYAVASVVIVSVVSFVGVLTLSLQEYLLKKYVFVLVSLAVGALLGDALIHLLPEAFETAQNPVSVPLLVIGGVLIFFIFEKFLHWHHHAHGEEGVETVHPTGPMILFSDGVHNFIDGLIIGASYLVSIEIGIATTIAVVLHEIPQEIGDFGVLVSSGYSKARALWLNFLSACTSIAGLLVAFLLAGAGEGLIVWLIPFAAGGFMYVAMSDLVPELHKTHSIANSILQVIAILVGVGAMIFLLALE